MSRVIVIGGHARNIGKTQMVEEILRAFPNCDWLAAKITEHGHGLCSLNGELCGCAEDEHTVAVDVETDAGRGIDTGTDTSRFLAAGAKRVLWVRTKQGRLAEAMPQLREEMEQAETVILESNAVLGFLRPDLYLPLLNFTVDDFKDTARTMLDRADAYVVVEAAPANESARQEVADAPEPLWRRREVRSLSRAEPRDTRPAPVTHPAKQHTEPPGTGPGEDSDLAPRWQVPRLRRDKPPGSAGERGSVGRHMENSPGSEEVLGTRRTPDWEDVSLKWLAERPVFRVTRERMCTDELAEFIRLNLFAGDRGGFLELPAVR